MHSLDALELDDHTLFDKQVRTKSLVELQAVEVNRNPDLSLDAESTLPQPARECELIHRLEKPWTKFHVKAYRAVHHRSADLVLMHLDPPSS